MKYLLVVLIVLLLTGCSASQFAMNTLIVADWGQTRDIATNPDYYEANKILGTHPSIGDVNVYFITSLAAINVGYYLMPVKYRDTFALIVAARRSSSVFNNYSLGIRIKL